MFLRSTSLNSETAYRGSPGLKSPPKQQEMLNFAEDDSEEAVMPALPSAIDQFLATQEGMPVSEQTLNALVDMIVLDNITETTVLNTPDKEFTLRKAPNDQKIYFCETGYSSQFSLISDLGYPDIVQSEVRVVNSKITEEIDIPGIRSYLESRLSSVSAGAPPASPLPIIDKHPNLIRRFAQKTIGKSSSDNPQLAQRAINYLIAVDHRTSTLGSNQAMLGLQLSDARLTRLNSFIKQGELPALNFDRCQLFFDLFYSTQQSDVASYLEYYQFVFNNITDMGVEMRGARGKELIELIGVLLETTNSLRTLKIDFEYYGTMREHLMPLSRGVKVNTSLKSFILCNSRNGSPSVDEIAALAGALAVNNTLTSFSLTDSGLTDKHVVKLVDDGLMKNRSITELDLHNFSWDRESIGTDGQNKLADLIKWRLTVKYPFKKVNIKGIDMDWRNNVEDRFRSLVDKKNVPVEFDRTQFNYILESD